MRKCIAGGAGSDENLSSRHKGHHSSAPARSVFLRVLYRPLGVPQHFPHKGEGVLSAKRGQDQRIVCACCRWLRPRLRSVSSRLTVCARQQSCVLDKPPEVGAVAEEFGRGKV